MNIVSVYSTKGSIDEIVSDIQHQLEGFETKLIIFFSSSVFRPKELSQKMQEGFGSATIFGCTTAGEIVSGKMLKNSVVVMAFNSLAIQDVKVEVVENIKENGDVAGAFNSFNGYFGEDELRANFDRYVGVVLIDGLSNSEEKIMDRIGNCSDLVFIGGSAGDDLKFSSTCVFARGKAYTNAAVLAILKTAKGYDIIKTQSFKVLDKKFVATKVNAEAREVIEFDDQPAVKAYAEALGIATKEVAGYFMTNPLALVAGDEIYVRSPQQIKGDRLVLYCNILRGMEVSLLESTDIVKDTRIAVEEKTRELGAVSAMINFHCILRTLELEQKGQTEEYGNIFKDTPTIGFSTYGEQFVGHINQTSTVLVFK